MTNNFAKIDGDSYFRNEMTIESQEPAEDSHLEADYEDRVSGSIGMGDEDDHHGWPGDGSGEDDLADFNANEVSDYRDE